MRLDTTLIGALTIGMFFGTLNRLHLLPDPMFTVPITLVAVNILIDRWLKER